MEDAPSSRENDYHTIKIPKVPGVSKNLYSPPLTSLLFTSHPLASKQSPNNHRWQLLEQADFHGCPSSPPHPQLRRNNVLYGGGCTTGARPDLNRDMRCIDKLEGGGRRWGARDFNEGSERGIKNCTGIPGLLEDEGERISRGGGGRGFLGILVGGRFIDSMKLAKFILELLELCVYFVCFGWNISSYFLFFCFFFCFVKIGLAKFFNCSRKTRLFEICKFPTMTRKRDKRVDRSWHFFYALLKKKKEYWKNFPYHLLPESE